MSSRDYRNRPGRPERDPRLTSSGSSQAPDRSSGADRGEFDVVDSGDDVDVDETSHSSSTGEKDARRGPLGGGTAEQIERLRRSMTQGSSRRTPSTQRQSLGRNYLARPEPVSSPVDDGNDDGFDQDADTYDDPLPPGQAQPSASSSGRGSYSIQRDTGYASSGIEPYPDDEEDPYYDDADDFDEYDAPRGSSWQRTQLRTGSQGQPITRPSLPPAITQADLVNDAAALSIIGIGILSLAAMAIVVANNADSLAPAFATHVSASGVLEHFSPTNGLWRLPLLSTMLTLMNIAAAWFVSPLDRFASRFLLAAALVVQIVAWVALIRIL